MCSRSSQYFIHTLGPVPPASPTSPWKPVIPCRRNQNKRKQQQKQPLQICTIFPQPDRSTLHSTTEKGIFSWKQTMISSEGCVRRQQGENTVAHSNRYWHFFVTGIKGAVLVQKPIQKQQHSLSPRKRLSREFCPEKLSTWIFRGFLKYIASKHEDIGLLFRFQSFSILEILSYRSQKLNPVLLTKFL